MGLQYYLKWGNVTHMGTNKREIGPDSVALARAIEAIEAEVGMRTPALAKESGVPLSTLRKILKQQSVADFEQIRRISDALGVRASELIARSEDIAERLGLNDKAGE